MFIPYSKQSLDEDDIAAVIKVLKSDWLTTGPKVDEFEAAIASYAGTQGAVAVSSGTAGLHAAMYALGIGSGDEVIVPPLTFIATANAVVYQGGTPVFADVDLGTLLINPADVEAHITKRTKAIVAVDYAGQPCDYDALQDIAKRNGIALVADACHALGAQYRGRPVGSLADMTVFSFHPVKHITTGEGGMVVTDNPHYLERMRRFRNHGISRDHLERTRQGTWQYEMTDLGYNYRLTDFQCALGQSQLGKLPAWLEARRSIARRYDAALALIPEITSLDVRPDVAHAYHLYVVRLGRHLDRGVVFQALQSLGILVNVHYIPVHLHPFYREHFGTQAGMCPIAEDAYEQILSLPMYSALQDQDVERVIDAIQCVVKERRL
ncbi:MAG: UDP-4-amino-4,6-dideoxy-N-acetyl-beta-L-altrosamine transaminase [Syntrophaceae bacterium]